MDKIDGIIIKNIHEDIIKRGVYPKFGSPEIKCAKCMFYKVTCSPSPEYVGCYGGWKREKE